jgi:23S rRNA (guanosine2251-2'-O)-methyltransferase
MSNEFIPGPNAVEEALRSGRRLTRLIVARDSEVARGPLVREARRRRIEVVFGDRAALDAVVGKMNHQGIVAIAEPLPEATLDDVFRIAESRREQPFVAVLDSVEDPHNLGAVIRSGHAAGIHGIIIPEKRAAKISPAVYKSSAGAVEYVKVLRVPSIVRALIQLKEKGLWIIGADMRGRKMFYEEDLSGPTAIVLGGEDRGVTIPVLEKCDAVVRIPMRGKVSSLNVSATAAILFFEKRRQELETGAKKK